MIRYEGVRFSDGSVALRRIDPDPCERVTRPFETMHECNEELGRREVITWLADALPRPAPRRVEWPEPPVTVREPTPQEVAYLNRYPDRPFPSPAELAASGYEPTEETDDP